MTVLEFEVLPENCLKNDHLELFLGTPINQVIVALQNASRIIKNVELVYCNKEPFQKDITITLKNDGIRLYFEPKAQILKLIEVFDFKNITLHYCNTVFSSPSDEANVSKVENCFGATHPGVYDEKQKMYLLHWRGVSFSFPAKEPSSTIQPSYAHGLSSLNFSNSSLPLLERMTIFCGSSPNEMRIPEVPVSVHCGNIFPIGIESINEEGKITGLRIVFLSEDDSVAAPRKTSEMARVERFVHFGDNEQSVLSALGAPAKIFYKSDEKMLIQRGSSSENIKNVDQPDFFFNYFSLGLDILFDCNNRQVLKFVLHTNVPGHFDFGIYSRCDFTIQVEGNDLEAPVLLQTDSKLESFRSLFTSSNPSLEDNDDEEENQAGLRRRPRPTPIKNCSSSSSSCQNKPVVLNKSASDGENPFGSTFCYGRADTQLAGDANGQLIVEVMDNSHIASVILYDSQL